MKQPTQEAELLPPEPQPHYQPPGIAGVSPAREASPPNALTVREPMEVARPQPTVAGMLHMVVERGISAADVSAFKELVQLHREEVKLNAEKEFAAAFVKLQQELPTIEGFRQVPDKHGNVKFAYANFDDIDAIVRPICLRNGFSYAFREGGITEGRVTVIMTLQHSGGHLREIPYSVRIGNGPPGATESQSDVSGHSYAQRGAIEAGLSLRVVGKREDAREEGTPITPAQVDELERRVALTNSNKEAFLKFAGATKFADIASGKYSILDEFLRKKERQ